MKQIKHLKLTRQDLGIGKKYIIPDIHGCFETFNALLDKIDFQKEDHLFLLGDYINRGPKSKQVIDYIIEKLNDGYQIYPLKGNHEEMAEKGLNFTENQLGEYHNLEPKYARFMEKLYYTIELEDALLVHAGINFKLKKPFEDIQSMLWSKKDYSRLYPTPPKRIIYGHTIKPLNTIKNEVHQQALWIPLDNGCYRKDSSNYGNLCCLELDAMELVIQKNIDDMDSWQSLRNKLLNSIKDEKGTPGVTS